jgi:hypothetical protein
LRTGLDAAVSRAGRQAQTDRAKVHAADVLPLFAQARQAGANSYAKVAAAMTARDIRPPGGGDRWHASQMRRIEMAGRTAV